MKMQTGTITHVSGLKPLTKGYYIVITIREDHTDAAYYKAVFLHDPLSFTLAKLKHFAENALGLADLEDSYSIANMEKLLTNMPVVFESTIRYGKRDEIFHEISGMVAIGNNFLQIKPEPEPNLFTKVQELLERIIGA